jgi:hypothetical protein
MTYRHSHELLDLLDLVTATGLAESIVLRRSAGGRELTLLGRAILDESFLRCRPCVSLTQSLDLLQVLIIVRLGQERQDVLRGPVEPDCKPT